MDAAVKYVNLGLTLLFVLLIVAFLIAALVGLFRGVWKSTYRMIFMLSLILISFVTLGAFTDFVASFPINLFKSGSFILSKTIDGEVVRYYVPITNAKETLAEFIKGFYYLNGISLTPSALTNYSLALATSVIKVGVVIIDMVLILTLGNLFCWLGWIIIFKRFIPKVARKKIKLKWVSLAETAVTFLTVTFLFMTPFTSIANSVNQAYQRNDVKNSKTENEMVQKVGNFVTAYNDSLFAKILFNWSVDDNGMTYDTRLFSNLTTGVSGDYTINLVKELVSFVNLAASGVDAVGGQNENGNTEFYFAELITKEFVDNAFDVVMNSAIIQTLLPIIVEAALEINFLQDYIPARLIDLSDVKWKNELGYLNDMVDCIFESGVLDDLFTVDENGHRLMKELKDDALINFIEGVVYSENFTDLLDVFKSIDESKVLSRAVPALVQFLINNDKEGTIKEFIPFTWEELNELSWGYETYVLFDFLHETAKLDDKFVKAIFVKTGMYKGDDADQYDLATLISEHAEGFKKLVVGNFDASGHLVNVDSHGQSIVFDSEGNRIQGRNYCLFDMNFISRAMPNILDRLFDLEALKDIRQNMSDADIEYYHQSIAVLNNGERITNYKQEFNYILDSVATLAADKDLLDALMSGKGLTPLMAEENNVFSIDPSHVEYFKNAISKMGQSNVLYCALAPLLKTLMNTTDFVNTLNDLGLKASVFISAIDQDMQRDRSQRQLFAGFASLLDRWPDLNNIYSLTGEGSDISIDKLKDDNIINSLKNILYELIDNPIVNPTPGANDDYDKNENLYGLIEYVFQSNPDLDLGINRAKLKSVESVHSWKDEIDAITDILQFMAKHNLTEASSTFENGLTHEGIAKLVGHTDDDYYIKGLFEAVDESYLFKTSLGPFLDDMFGDSLNGFLIDQEHNVTFSNISNWSVEGENIENLLKSLDNILPENDSEAQNFFEQLDITTLDKIVELNAMLHDLANSGIFTYIDEGGISHYQFGKWLYNIIDTSMGSFSVDENEYDLLSDPKFSTDSVDGWNLEEWGIRPEDSGEPDPYYLEWKNEYNADGSKTETHYIAYKDFVYVNGMSNTDPRVASFWCDYDAFVNAQTAFTGGEYGNAYSAPSEYLANDWGKYYGSDDFMTAYQDVFEVDEISRVMKFTCYAMRLLQPRTDNTKIAFNEIPKSLLEGMLFSLNETHCMRVGIYNFYRIAAENVFSAYSSSGFSLSSAYITYMIDVDQPMYDFEAAYDVRHDELEIFSSFYDLLNIAKEDGVISSGHFVFENMMNNNFLDVLKETLNEVNDSYVFHRKGSSKVGQLTTFQGLFDHLLSDGEIGSSLYLGSNSPKDAANVSLYDSTSAKARYLVTSIFPDDANNPYDNRNNQKSEINKLIVAIDELYSLVDSGGDPVTSISNADLNNDDNIDALWRVLGALNDSALLCDLVPNSIYKMFISEPQFSVSVGGESVDFTRIDPFYHYYYNVDTLAKLGTPNFEDARYSSDDIDGFRQLLVDYSAFNTTLNGASVTDTDVLKNLTGTIDGSGFHATGALSDLLRTMHDNPIFHTPARDYDYGMYYTTKFENDGYTLFEEMINDIALGSGIADYAFDSAYDSASTAAIKLHNNIKEITKADDGKASLTCYATGEGQAWNKEISALMEVAYRAADLSAGSSIDVSNINLEDLNPQSAKTMLVAINRSEIAGDAVAKIVKDGFDAIGLDALTIYQATRYANYHIGRLAYGGNDGNAGNDTEINNIYNVLLTLRDGDNYVTNFSDIMSFVMQDSFGNRLRGVMRYIYESKILNTPVNGLYNDYYSVSGYDISAQGVLLYSIFDNANLSDFIARDAMIDTTSTALDKIETLSYIVHMPTDDQDAITDGLTYEIESDTLHSLLTAFNSSGIDASTFVGAGHENISSVKAHKQYILEFIESTYRDGRSPLTSELVGGLLNNILENEYKGLNSKTTYAYNYFAFGKDLYDAHVTYSCYSSLNEIEKNGMQGILDSLDYIGQLNISSLSSMSDDDRHNFANNLADCFYFMSTDGVNSEIARIVYLNDVHPTLKIIAPTPNKNEHTFLDHLVDETSISTSVYDRTIYSDDFNFEQYGVALSGYIYPGFY